MHVPHARSSVLVDCGKQHHVRAQSFLSENSDEESQTGSGTLFLGRL
jgi:hypothetical protein